jgi:phosphoserine phosphatase
MLEDFEINTMYTDSIKDDLPLLEIAKTGYIVSRSGEISKWGGEHE